MCVRRQLAHQAGHCGLASPFQGINVANLEQQPESVAAPIASDLPTRGLARRRFTRAGILATGAISTVANATGTITKCATASGSLSGGLASHTPTIKPVCGGLSPGGWLQPGGGEVWPCAKTKKFGTVFSCSGKTAKYANYTLYNLLDPQYMKNKGQTDDYMIARHFVASYLNVISVPSKTNVITYQILKNMWNAYNSAKGYYEPSAGVKWYGPQIVAYLAGIMV
jgi:hypothetical protein